MGRSSAFVLVNPSAAGGRGAREWEQFAGHQAVPDHGFTTPTEGAEILVRRACDDGYRTILVCGGDGTVSEAANALMEIHRTERPTLGILPAGTANDFARAIGHTSWSRVLAAVERPARMVDVGLAEGAFGRRHFLVAAFIGTPAEIAGRANEGGKPVRGLAGYLPYLRKAALMTVPVIVEFDSDTWAGSATTAVVSNTRNGAGGIRICPDARVDDGRLDLLFIEHRRRRGLTVTLALDALLVLTCFVSPGLSSLVPGVDVRRATATRVELKADGAQLALDGEIVGQLPATIEVLPSALDVVGV
ncbi:MAG TPA: diacylglycerol kinase family protein [Armatimonadota bacterium]|jgi:YegS/Rv2252/BmrU family lipid kinase